MHNGMCHNNKVLAHMVAFNGSCLNGLYRCFVSFFLMCCVLDLAQFLSLFGE